MLTFDIETDGLRATKVHCISFHDGQEIRTAPGLELLDELFSSPVICGHNVIDYDIPTLEYLSGRKYKGRAIDTLVMSRSLKADRKWDSKGHGLEDWGVDLGYPKVKVASHEWLNLDYDKAKERCERDVEITVKLYDHLIRFMKSDDAKWEQAIRMEHKVAEIMKGVAQYGVNFDRGLADRCVDELVNMTAKLDEDIVPLLPYVCKRKESADAAGPYTPVAYNKRGREVGESQYPGRYNYVKKPFLKSGKHNKWVAGHYGDDVDQVWGPFSRIELRPMKPNSRNEAVTFLLSDGWKPAEWNGKFVPDPAGGRDLWKVTSPKMSQSEEYIGVTSEVGKLLAKRFQIGHRLANIRGYIDKVREDGRIESQVNPCGTPTGRMTHKGVANVPGEPKFYWKEMRGLFRDSPGKTLVSCDADSCQLRMLAEIMDDFEFSKAVTEGKKEDGSDVHSLTAGIIGQIRKYAKNFNFAYVFGAGNAKLGHMMGGFDDKVGMEARQKFELRFPKLKSITTRYKAQVKSMQYIKGLDGRKIYCNQPHKAVNYKCQSDESIMMKYAICLFDAWKVKNNVDCNIVIVYHDEYTVECNPEDADRIGKQMALTITEAGKRLGLTVKQGGTPSSGANWGEIH